MSQTGHLLGDDPDGRHDPDDPDDPDDADGLVGLGESEPRRRRGRGCLAVLVVLVVLVAGAWFGGRLAYDQLSTRLAPAPDYPGPGTGEVLYEVKQGASSTSIARELKAADVVRSVDAFTEAARAEEKSRSVQVGFYPLKRQMKASDALAVLIDPENLLQSLVVVPEGARVQQVVDTIVDRTDISRRALLTALADPAAIGLPATAKGNPEGFLFPATYTVPPEQTAAGLIGEMVAKTVAVEKSLDIEVKARRLGHTPAQVLTVASMIEYEVNKRADYPKVARVIYNRLDEGMPLQLDSTVAYISKRKGDVFTTAKERESGSPYNTYVHTGLPPGPIGSPGRATIEAALNPARGDWLYFVADYESDTTRFSSTLAEHNKWVEKLRQHCRTSEDC